VVVVGRGPISRIAVQWLQKNRPACPILWVNRSVETLRALPESEGVKTQRLSEFLAAPSAFSHLITATSSQEPLFSDRFFALAGGPRKMVLDLAQPPDVERGPETARYIELLHLEDLKEEANANRAERIKSIEEASTIIEASLREYCREQKEAPVLRDFNAIEPRFLEELSQALSVMEKEFPAEVHAKIRKWAERLVKKNLHCSRELLRDVLRRVSEPDEEGRARIS
jgi:glutamyl-tRNA reductase